MPKYILLLEEAEKLQFSPEEMQAIVVRYKDWRNNLNASGQKLQDGTARFMKKVDGKVTVKDGPFVETKEFVAGFFMIEARDYDHAVELCRDCPHLEFGTIEIRQVDEV